MERKAKFVLGLTLFLLASFAVGFYSYARSKEFRVGPVINIAKPADGSVFLEPLVVISGRAENVSRISLNDGQIFVDANGNFSEKLLLLPGYNILTLRAEDRFGKKVIKTLELIYKEPQKESLMASSTPLGL